MKKIQKRVKKDYKLALALYDSGVYDALPGRPRRRRRQDDQEEPAAPLAGVDEQHVIWLLALLQHKNADRDARGIEQTGWHADDCVDVTIIYQLAADAFLCATRNKTPCGRMIAITPSSFR
jgi:hypothetical protein